MNLYSYVRTVSRRRGLGQGLADLVCQYVYKCGCYTFKVPFPIDPKVVTT